MARILQLAALLWCWGLVAHAFPDPEPLAASATDSEAGSKALQPPVQIDPHLRRALLQALTRLEQEAEEEASRLGSQQQADAAPTDPTPVAHSPDHFPAFPHGEDHKDSGTALTQVSYDEELTTDALGQSEADPTQTSDGFPTETTTQLPVDDAPITSVDSLPDKLDIQSNEISTTNGHDSAEHVHSPPTTAVNDLTIESSINNDKSSNFPVSTEGPPQLDANDREVSIFQAPLVAAFTLHHDLDGLPQKVVPLFRPRPTAATLVTEKQLQSLAKERELEQRTIQLQQQLFKIQNLQAEQQRRQEQLRQQQLFQEQERLRQHQLQQQLLLEQQRILQQQQQQQQQLLAHQQRQRAINFQLQTPQFFQQSNSVPFLQQSHQPFFPLQTLQSSQSVQNNQLIQPNQPLVQVSQSLPFNQNFQTNPPIPPIQPVQPTQSIQPTQPIQPERLRSQRQETGTAIVDFQKSLTLPLIPPPPSNSPIQASASFNNNNVFGDSSVQSLSTNQQFGSTSRNTQKLNLIDNPQLTLHPNFSPVPNKIQRPADKQLQHLLLQSGIARDLQRNVHNGAIEDINILTKILSLNHQNEETESQPHRSSRKTLESHHVQNIPGVHHIQPPAIHLVAPHF